jgi:hypothetical protein
MYPVPFSVTNAALMPAYRGVACIESSQGPAQGDGIAARQASPRHVANIPTYRPNVAGLIAKFEALASKPASSTRPTRDKCVADGQAKRSRTADIPCAPLESPGLVAAAMRTVAGASARPELPTDGAITPNSPTRALVSKQGAQISAFLGFGDHASGGPERLRGM